MYSMDYNLELKSLVTLYLEIGKLKIGIEHHCHKELVQAVSAMAATGPLHTLLLTLCNSLPVPKIQIGFLRE